MVGHRQYPLRRLGHHGPGRFQRPTLTLGAGLTLHGQSGEITGTFINQGTISVDLAGRPAGSTADEDLDPHRHRLDQSGDVASR